MRAYLNRVSLFALVLCAPETGSGSALKSEDAQRSEKVLEQAGVDHATAEALAERIDADVAQGKGPNADLELADDLTAAITGAMGDTGDTSDLGDQDADDDQDAGDFT